MNDKFFNLADEKQQLILVAAIQEFALQGYDKASTDTITSSAGISKGSLFNYFTSKLNLYLYVLEYVIIKINKEELKEIQEIKEVDFYDRFKKISIIKHKMYMRYPEETRIITAFLMNPSKSIDGSFQKLKKYYATNVNDLENYLIKYLDANQLREGITKEDVLFITTALFEALIKRHQELVSMKLSENTEFNNDKILDLDKYIEVLKHGLYKV